MKKKLKDWSIYPELIANGPEIMYCIYNIVCKYMSTEQFQTAFGFVCTILMIDDWKKG